MIHIVYIKPCIWHNSALHKEPSEYLLYWGFRCSGIWHFVSGSVVTDVSNEHSAFILKGQAVFLDCTVLLETVTLSHSRTPESSATALSSPPISHVVLFPWQVYLANVCNWVHCHMVMDQNTHPFSASRAITRTVVLPLYWWLLWIMADILAVGTVTWPIFLELHHSHYGASIRSKKC